MSQSLLSLKTRNRLWYWVEQWHAGERHEEFVDAGFEDYGFMESDEDNWELAFYQNEAYWKGFKDSIDFSLPETLKKLCPILDKALREMNDWPSKHEFVDLLQRDGFVIENGKVSYSTERTSKHAIREIIEKFDLFAMQYQLSRIESSVEHDPALAIGSAKELIESCCKTILSERNVECNSSWDVPQLVKATIKELKLAPDDIPEPKQDTESTRKAVEAMRVMLQNLAAIAGRMAELRNAVGTGHGPNGQVRGPKPRHARLAVNATAALVMFLFETHVARVETEKVAQS